MSKVKECNVANEVSRLLSFCETWDVIPLQMQVGAACSIRLSIEDFNRLKCMFDCDSYSVIEHALNGSLHTAAIGELIVHAWVREVSHAAA